MTASMRPWFGTLPAWQAYPAMLLVTDGGWLAAMRYREHGGANAAFYVAGGIVLYFVWLVSSIPGFLLAEQLADPQQIRRRPGDAGVLRRDAGAGMEGRAPRHSLGGVGRGGAGGALRRAGLLVHHRRRAVGRDQRRADRRAAAARPRAAGMSEFLRSDVMLAFAVMTAVTVASRLGGYFLMRYVTVTPRIRRMLDALPGSIIVAAALPVAVNGGLVVMGALAAALGDQHHPPQRFSGGDHRHDGGGAGARARHRRLIAGWRASGKEDLSARAE